MKQPNVSIVVSTFNNPITLKKTLEGMLLIDYSSNFEIIVVNDGSTDNTKQMLEENFSKNSKIKIINFEKNQGVCKARNAGINQAKYEIVVNMDHDCIPEKNWLIELVKPFENQNVGIVTGYGGYGGTSTAFRKKLLDEVGGYDEDYFYYREDTDLAFKILELGYVIEKVPAKYFHDHVMTKPKGLIALIKHVLQRLKYHQNDVLLYKKHPNELTCKFLDIRFGFLINPLADFNAATGLWHKKGKFKLSSPRGITFIENKTLLHTIVIVVIGVLYVFAVKTSRFVGSIKHRKFLI